MTNYVCFLVVSFLFLFVSLNELKAGDIPPPETIGACCLNSELGICEELSLDECVLSGDLGFGWSDELSCEPDTCIPDTQGNEDCCTEHSSTACENLECSQTICEIDPYCCIFEWDDICVDEANELCGDLCPDIPQGPIVIVPTLNEWGLIFTALIIGIYAVLRLKTKKGSEA